MMTFKCSIIGFTGLYERNLNNTKLIEELMMEPLEVCSFINHSKKKYNSTKNKNFIGTYHLEPL